MSDAMSPMHKQTLRASFTSAPELQQAIDALGLHGFDQYEVAVTENTGRHEPVTRDADAVPAHDAADVQQAHSLHAGGAAAVAGLAAAGVAVATGGLAVMAVGAAVVAGAAAGGLIHAVGTAVKQAEQVERDAGVAEGRLVISVQVPTFENIARAEAILQQAGACDITTI